MTRTQHGGIKIIFDTRRQGETGELDVMSREIRTIQSVNYILDNTRVIDSLYTSSLNSFIIRLHINPEQILFRSNIFDTKTSRFTKESLTLSRNIFSSRHVSLKPDKLLLENEGLPVREIIVKMSILYPNVGQPAYPIKPYKSNNKAALTKDEFKNEYDSQRYLYNSMMSSSGRPFCPDAFGLFICSDQTEWDELSSKILSKILRDNPSTELQDIIRYMNMLVGYKYNIGLIFMESIPDSYIPLYHLSPQGSPHYDRRKYENMCEVISAINILTLYRGEMIHLDGHSGNWLCDPDQQNVTEKVKEIDFGRIYRIGRETRVTDGRMRDFIRSLQTNVNRYFLDKYKLNQRQAISLLQKLYTTIQTERNTDINFSNQSDEREIYIMFSNLLDKVKVLLHNIINTMIYNFTEKNYFSQQYRTLEENDKNENINMIHLIIIICIYIDFFYNCSNYQLDRGQIAHVYKIIFNTTRILDIETISEYNLNINFDIYKQNNFDNGEKLLQTYINIYNILYEFNQDRQFPSIREYQRFKEFHQTKAQIALRSIRDIGSALWECPLIQYPKSAIIGCSSAACRAFSSAFSSVGRYAVAKAVDYLPSIKPSDSRKPPNKGTGRASSPGPHNVASPGPHLVASFNGGFRSSRTKRTKRANRTKRAKRYHRKYTKKH